MNYTIYPYLHFLKGVPKKKHGRLLLENLSPRWIRDLKVQAASRGDSALVDLAIWVEAQYKDKFDVTLRFSSGQAVCTVYVFNLGGRNYFHVDYDLNDKPEGQAVMLYRNNEGRWVSDKALCNVLLAESIKRPLDNYVERIQRNNLSGGHRSQA